MIPIPKEGVRTLLVSVFQTPSHGIAPKYHTLDPGKVLLILQGEGAAVSTTIMRAIQLNSTSWAIH